MLRRLERTLVPRGYEMNATGTIPLSVVARYLEHCRWEAMTDAAFQLRSVWGRGVVRAQRIDVLAPLRFGHEIRMTACVGRVGRTSLELVHSVEATASGETVARAAATLVNLGPDGRPSPLSPQAADLVLEAEPPQVAAPNEDAPDTAFAREIVVSASDQDIQQHVNQARYIDYVEDTRAFAVRQHALGVEHAESGGALGRRVAIEYARQATVGDRLRVLLWGMSGEPRAFGAEIRNDGGELVARARVET